MTNEQILKKAIGKAIKGGWKSRKGKWLLKQNPIDFSHITQDYYSIIFSHDFAKAFWGEEENGLFLVDYDGNYISIKYDKIWKFHLQRLVLEKEPLKYIEKFL